jgi:hypothetical protein
VAIPQASTVSTPRVCIRRESRCEHRQAHTRLDSKRSHRCGVIDVGVTRTDFLVRGVRHQRRHCVAADEVAMAGNCDDNSGLRGRQGAGPRLAFSTHFRRFSTDELKDVSEGGGPRFARIPAASPRAPTSVWPVDASWHPSPPRQLNRRDVLTFREALPALVRWNAALTQLF